MLQQEYNEYVDGLHPNRAAKRKSFQIALDTFRTLFPDTPMYAVKEPTAFYEGMQPKSVSFSLEGCNFYIANDASPDNIEAGICVIREGKSRLRYPLTPGAKKEGIFAFFSAEFLRSQESDEPAWLRAVQ